MASYGYVRVRHLKSAPSFAPNPPIVTQPIPAATGVGYIKEGIIANFRTGPGTAYAVISELPAGTPVELIEVQGSWYVAVVGGVTGYISAVCIV